MDENKKLPGSGVRNAAVIGGITGGLFGANAPIIYPETVKHANDTVTYINSAIPIPIKAGEESTIMASGGYSTLAGAGLGTLGGAAAYYILKGLGKGAARAYKAGKRAYENHEAKKEEASKLDKSLDNFSEKPKTGKMNPKVKKALKVAGAIGAAGALGTAGAIAGDALNLWDLGDVEGVAGKLLSPLDKAGNALNEMASAPALNELKEVKRDLEDSKFHSRIYKEGYYDLTDDLVKIGKAYERGEKVSLEPLRNHEGITTGFRVSAEGPEKLSRYLYSLNVPVK